MNPHIRRLITIAAITFAASSYAKTEQFVTISVIDANNDKSSYTIPDFQNDRVLLPIKYLGQSLLADIRFSQKTDSQESEIYVELQDPSIQLPGLVSPTLTLYPKALTIYSATFLAAKGKQITLLKGPSSSITLQIEHN